MAIEQQVERFTEAGGSTPPGALTVPSRMNDPDAPRSDEEKDLARKFGGELSRIDIAENGEYRSYLPQWIEECWVDEISTVDERFTGAEAVERFRRYRRRPAEAVSITEYTETERPVVRKLERDAAFAGS